jgi:hypothetical protein
LAEYFNQLASEVLLVILDTATELVAIGYSTMEIFCLIFVLCIAATNSFPSAPIVQIDELQSDDKIDLSSFGVMLFSEPD